MDIASVKPVFTGVTSPVPKTPTEQNQSTTTDLSAEKAVKVAEKTDGNAVDTSTDKPQGQGAGLVSANALTKANTVKASPLDQVSGFEVLMSSDSKAPEQAAESPANAAVAQDSQEFAMRMQAMIEAWEGTGGSPRSAVFDRKL
ncbi:hypothetical protein CXZ10_05395 [Pleomorphomonas diazotrophica]|uniref:Uncharacterized protein n=1 Tax=Pleomorphomonas diazotrophica TaxID=1166257 RepID=A0A1I4QBM2_9HYPH|nr:hypothetical protein [Pleomorphomonas diazotrophica]PKR90789.1 hypothetical protein CXZ10_05395 [Pleomorphomonas diazotrophica]SFM37447.1 hypothetical protein SAMN05192571_101233 [Pleomorphomonas diazotrophica]